MAAPFVVEGATPGTQVWGVDASGNTVQSGTLNAIAQGATYQTGIDILTAGAGFNSSVSANVLGGGTIASGLVALLGTAASGTQLADITRDYMVYIGVTAGGAAANSACPADKRRRTSTGEGAPEGAERGWQSGLNAHTEHATWAAAYLVLVWGVAQVGLGMGQWLCAGRLSTALVVAQVIVVPVSSA